MTLDIEDVHDGQQRRNVVSELRRVEVSEEAMDQTRKDHQRLREREREREREEEKERRRERRRRRWRLIKEANTFFDNLKEKERDGEKKRRRIEGERIFFFFFDESDFLLGHEAPLRSHMRCRDSLQSA